MAKKSRTIPTVIFNIDFDGKIDIEALCNNESFSNAVYKETVEGIKDAISNKKKIAILFELDKSDYYVEISKDQWKPALQSCIDKFIENELYEKCNDIKILIDKI
jgi:hypothetical protein